MAKKRNKNKNKNKGKQKFQAMLRKEHLEFWKTIKKISDSSGASDAFNKIPKSDYNFIESFKSGKFFFEFPDSHNIDKDRIDFLNKSLNVKLKKDKIKIVEGKPEITFEEYFTAGSALKMYLIVLKRKNSPIAKEITEGYKAFLDKFEDHYAEKSMGEYAFCCL